MRHPDDLRPLLAVIQRCINIFEVAWIEDSRNGIDEIDPVLAEVGRRLRIVPFEIHAPLYRIPVVASTALQNPVGAPDSRRDAAYISLARPVRAFGVWRRW